MVVCANCGTKNQASARFCEECGADLRTLAPPIDPARLDRGPFPELLQTPQERKRSRTWLWIVVGGLGGCVLLCCVLFIAAAAVGEDTLNDWATQMSEWVDDLEATNTPIPRAPAPSGTQTPSVQIG